MKEIGGYIELDNFRGKMLHENAKHLNCGRTALVYLIESRYIKKIWLPYFMCESVFDVCKKCSVEIKYYHVDYNFKIEKLNVRTDEWLYVVNYYGQLSDQYILELKKKYKNIILDNAQAYFDMPLENIDTLYTCRKFFGVSDGAILYTNSDICRDLSVDESFERIHYILGRYERTAGEFYKESSDNNSFFRNEPIKQMSRLTENILHGIDYDYIEKRRTENFAYLNEIFAKINRIKVKNVLGAFMFPFMVSNAENIRKRLAEKKIFVPVLWPNVLKECPENSVEYHLANDILPLPCDQRYGIDDIDYIIQEVSKYVQAERT